jgi:hypothetical protein
MRLSTCMGAMVVIAIPALAAGCSGAGDPLGGPYGGTAGLVAPNSGNVNESTDDAGAGIDDDASSDPGASGSGSGATSGSASGGGSSGSSGSSRSGSTSSGGTGSSSGAKPSSSGSGSGTTGASSGGAGSSGGASAPTWSAIFSKYLANGTVGGCPRCHFQMFSASASYSYLQSQRYIGGTGSLLVKSGSCLSWYGGTMPPGGPRTNAQATSDMNAWVAAGAMNN